MLFFFYVCVCVKYGFLRKYNKIKRLIFLVRYIFWIYNIGIVIWNYSGFF